MDDLAGLHPTFRSIVAAELAAGSSKVAIGWHNYGLALDILIIDAAGSVVKDGDDYRYRRYGNMAKKQGCAWGGDFHSLHDGDHIEYHPGFTMAQYQAWLLTHPDPLAA